MSGKTPKKVLVVDDSKTSLQAASGLLASYGMTVRTADSGREAVEILSKERFDLVLMDHMMPDMDGMETTKILRRKGEDFVTLPVILATSNDIAEIREEMAHAGLNDYIAKPMDPAELKKIMTAWIPEFRQSPVQVSSQTQYGGIPAADGVICDKIGGGGNCGRMEQKEKLLDVPTGLRYSGGDGENYRMNLKTFLKTLEEDIQTIQRSYADEDWKMLTIKFHAVKGIAGTIGAAPLSTLAGDLETAGKEGNVTRIGKHLDAFFELCQTTVDAVRGYSGEDTESHEKQPPDMERLRTALEEMSQYLKQYNARQAGRTFAGLADYAWDTETADHIRRIEKSLSRYDYGQGIEEIETALEQMGGRQPYKRIKREG
ncbi:MAG: response regulator [Planctomycetaceae bacterium]|jgi:CheY-like chemotaxis protein|nr:response regulator [Planctomycetaceae bacterium]